MAVPKEVEERLLVLERLFETHNVIDHDSSYSVETLLDAAMVLYDECCTSSFKKEKTVSEFVSGAKPVVENIKKLRLSIDDFETLECIGRGAFGEVNVVKLKGTERVYALKILNKWEMLKRHQVSLVLQEYVTTGSTCYWSALADIREIFCSISP